jgi:predicted cobalt transporter CbtA
MTIGAAIVVATVLVLARYLPDFRQGLFITFFALAVATLGTGNRAMTIGVAIVLATVLVLATHHPGFRRGLLVILSALAIAGASVAFLNRRAFQVLPDVVNSKSLLMRVAATNNSAFASDRTR